MIELYVDGICDPNPGGIAAWGYAAYREGRLVGQGQGVAAEGNGATTPVSEYAALVQGLQAAIREGWAQEGMNVYADNLAVIKQVLGFWPVRAKSSHLAPWRDMARALLAQCKAALHKIDGNQNKADQLSREALREARYGRV